MPHESTVDHDEPEHPSWSEFNPGLASRSRDECDVRTDNGSCLPLENHHDPPLHDDRHLPKLRAETPLTVTHHHDVDDSDEGESSNSSTSLMDRSDSLVNARA